MHNRQTNVESIATSQFVRESHDNHTDEHGWTPSHFFPGDSATTPSLEGWSVEKRGSNTVLTMDHGSVGGGELPNLLITTPPHLPPPTLVNETYENVRKYLGNIRKMWRIMKKI